ncbi:MAG TPA: TetR/AcrR family transcriptional regulator [Homoserinimonas sp.]|nr:TetR/AcrR family transcriptional regulator [Homoserinimonas sp.]
MPKLWSESIEEHRRAVRDAALDATGDLVAARGLPSVTMSRIADRAGIGRATLYKYFTDADAVIAAWHERLIADHLHRLHEAKDSAHDATGRLEAVLTAYAFMSHHRRGTDAAPLLHESEHVAQALQQLTDFVRDLLAEAAASGEVRSDVPPAELAVYCLHALSAARGVTSQEAVRRLVTLTLDGLRVGD